MDDNTEVSGVVLSEEGESGRNPDTFDLNTFLSGTLKFPKYKATIYTNATAAVEITQVLDDKQEAEKNLALLKSKQQAAERQSGGLGGSLGTGNFGNEILALEEKIAGLTKRHEALDEEFKSSKLELVFQLQKPWLEMDKEINEDVKKKYPDLPASNTPKAGQHEGWQYKSLLMTLNLLISVKNIEGEEAREQMTIDHVRQLFNYLPTSETQKLNQAVEMTINGGSATQRAIDAGFPR